MSAITLTDDQLEQLADLIAARLAQRSGRSGCAAVARQKELVSAGELARLLGVHRSFVYAHADDLGAVRIGSGPKRRLRFDVETATAAMSCSAGVRSQAPNPSTEAESEPAPARSARRLPSRLPPPGSVLAIRGPDTPSGRPGTAASASRSLARHAATPVQRATRATPGRRDAA